VVEDDAQNSDTKIKYAEDNKMEGSSSLFPWKTKKIGKRKRKNGPVLVSDVSSRIENFETD
jgi:hypothetical protein